MMHKVLCVLCNAFSMSMTGNGGVSVMSQSSSGGHGRVSMMSSNGNSRVSMMSNNGNVSMMSAGSGNMRSTTTQTRFINGRPTVKKTYVLIRVM